MASTYTTNAGIELIATGEQSGTWGDTTNTNLQIIDRLTNGVGAISLSGTTHTLTTTDGTLSDGQYSVLVFGGSPSGTNTVTISPNTAQHVYIVKNSSGQSVVLTQGSGGNVTVANGKSAIVYADGAGSGAAVVDVTDTFEMSNVSITGGSITGITDLAVADGGTGVSTVPTNGQLLIGNGSGYTVSTLTAGSGVSITNGSGSVTINATGTGGTVTSVSGTGTVNGITLSGTVTSSGNLTLGGTFSATVSEISDLTATAAEINKLDGFTGTYLDLNYAKDLRATGVTTTEFDKLDGLTATTAELNYLDITTLGSSQASKAVTADANGNVKLLEEVQAVCYLETVIGLSGTTPTVDCDEGNTFTLTTSGNTTFTFSYAGVQLTSNDAYAFTLRITSGGTHTLTWPASVDWPGGSAPDAPASGETDVYVFFTTDGGTNWYGFLAGDALA